MALFRAAGVLARRTMRTPCAAVPSVVRSSMHSNIVAAPLRVGSRNFGSGAPGQAEDHHTFLSRKEVEVRLFNSTKYHPKFPKGKELSLDTHIEKDLELDSLDRVELIMAFEDEFQVQIPDQEAEQIHTLGDALTVIVNNPNVDNQYTG